MPMIQNRESSNLKCRNEHIGKALWWEATQIFISFTDKVVIVIESLIFFKSTVLIIESNKPYPATTRELSGIWPFLCMKI